MMKKFLSLVFVLAAYLPVLPAHPGRTDAHGCHTNRKTGVYHCHTPKGSAKQHKKAQARPAQNTPQPAPSKDAPNKDQNQKGSATDTSKNGNKVPATKTSDNKKKLPKPEKEKKDQPQTRASKG